MTPPDGSDFLRIIDFHCPFRDRRGLERRSLRSKGACFLPLLAPYRDSPVGFPLARHVGAPFGLCRPPLRPISLSNSTST